MNIFIPEEVLSEHMDNYEMLAYCYLKILTPLKEIKQYYISMNMLLYTVYEREDVSQDIRQSMYTAVNSLFNRGIVKGRRCGRQSYIVDNALMYVDTQKQHFVSIEIEDIFAIMRSNNKVRVPLVRYYIYLMSTRSSKILVHDKANVSRNYIVGTQTQDYLSSLTGNSVWTIRRYNQLLEDMNVVYIYRAEDFLLSNNRVKQLPNVYGRYNDKEYIIQYGKELQEQNRSRNYTRPKLAQSDNKRRLYKMYYWLCHGKEYSESEIREIYEYVITENKKYRKLAESKQDKRYLEKLKDETVFAKYPFLFQGEE